MENTNFSEKDEAEQLPPFDAAYQVMPGGNGNVQSSEPESAVPENPLPVDHGSGNPFRSKIALVIIGILVLLALGAAAYFLIGSNPKEEAIENTPTVNDTQNQSKLPSSWLTEYFNLDTCSDKALCGDDADPDKDGLSNLAEFQSKTDPQKPDTDSDGLADSDEVNIYKTDPTKMYSYCNVGDTGLACSYDDGTQVSNDYDPSTPGKKMVQSRLDQLSSDIAQYQLHEPTISTIKNKRTATTK